jgi:PKD-like family
MKSNLFYLFILLTVVFTACKKDLGNYHYSPPTEPLVEGLDGSTVDAIVGDSLILRPYVYLAGANPATDLTFDWDIIVVEEARADHYTGYPLKMVYNLKPMLRTAKLTVTDNRNGIKYFYAFSIRGGTKFSIGTTVLSVDQGVTKLSFIRPDSTVNSNLYYALHNEDLPTHPVQLFSKPLAYQAGTTEDYWVICQDPAKASVIIDGSTMLRKHYFNDQFFSPPSPLLTEAFEGSTGTPTGIINGKLYLSVTSTAPFAPDFGKFSSMQTGDYYLSKYYTRTGNFFFGLNTQTNTFVSFDGGGNYMGADYTVTGNAFDPKNLGAGELLYMQAIPGITYAFFKAADGNLYEYTFSIDMTDYNQRAIKPISKRIFKGAALVEKDTKWARSTVDLFYFTSGDKIYAYNPVNQDLYPLSADFGGKKVTMIQLNREGTQLTAGVEGSILTLDVSVGKNGVITNRVNGIPGSPVDIVIRK